jgi:hypothetical protein
MIDEWDGKEIIYLEFEYPWQEGMNLLLWEKIR